MFDPRRRPQLLPLSLAAVLATAIAGHSLADEPKVKPASKDAQRASGVIVKAEKAKDQAGKLILTINTAAVWRDWVRDQATESARQSPRKDARDGAESIATKGEPRDKDTLVKVEVAKDSRVETRFRAPDDETTKGTKTPDGSGDASAQRQSGKPTQFRIDDLKSGLFIEADFRRQDGCNVASAVAVIRPIPPSNKQAETAK